MNQSSYQYGIVLVSISAIVWSTVGLFAKGIEQDVWIILFWRGLFSVIALGVYVYFESAESLKNEFQRLGYPGWISVFVGAAATVCFISAFKYTSIANVSIMYVVVPFIVSILAWVLMKEKSSLITLLAAGISLIGVITMVRGSLGSINLLADFLAICMSIGMAILVVIFRMYPGRPMVLATILSAAIHVVISLFLSSPFDVGLYDLLWLLCFGIVFAAATIFMIEGARLIPASQSALISTGEAPLAPLWAWLVFANIPSLQTWIGGGLVFVAVL
ncbi:MAG: drug/metabolite transporter (DMT)-like permease, partial [Gammaproteobacteria bacterium]